MKKKYSTKLQDEAIPKESLRGINLPQMGVPREKKLQKIGTWIGLFAIVLFAMYLRYEDFSVWQKHKTAFQYRGEYQMANFDSYYYLQLAKDVQEGVYDGFDEKRHVPEGVERPYIPPLLALLTVTISSLTAIPLTTVAIFMPVVLSSLMAVVLFFLCRGLRLNRISALSAALFSIISLTYVVRTRIGVFDTDCLNVVFLVLNSYLFLQFGQLEDYRRYRFLAFGFVCTVLYFLWWDTANSVVLLSALVPLSVALLFFYKTKKPFVKYGFLAMAILLGLYVTKDQVFSLFELLLGTTTDFPNNLGISELDKVSLDGFIEKTTDNRFVFFLMLAGFVLMIWKLRVKTLFLAMPILLAVLPFIAGNRFIIFSAPIMALTIGYVIQLLFDFKGKLKPALIYGTTLIIVLIGVFSTYGTITKKYEKAAVFENRALLDALENNTLAQSNIWTDQDLGYQIQYYLDRGTFLDGGFSPELSYYLYFPLAVEDLSLAANYMQFYSVHGPQGMRDLYALFPSISETFLFLGHVLSQTPEKAAQWLRTGQRNGRLPKTDKFTTVEEWLSFLYPEQKKDMYLFMYYKMTQTASWFKQGHSDLETGKTMGLPLFLTFTGLKERGQEITNHQISLDTRSGTANYLNQKRYFQSLSTFDGIRANSKTFPAQTSLQGTADNRFVFQWNKNAGFGAAMSKEMANTTLVKLYLLQQESLYFEPVSIHTPAYQIWKIKGDVYERE
ncbi:dolichyl-diphosphooligosaccharide--protein glycosyltransferase subunit STT3 [Muricauda sp. SCSIO 64092]|uniref:dolichyl-diphosphooligosaccharide--protein glycosyltransferase subunit STT3 n=1 Tax=Allomuricauda sp. SCSIO 64092 TaxID=2908842 RepID=UPI001FF22D3D|nr:dolichyl-diphosphooligosaccharide--protein glycosyltransferase subunit STT3 [Muricauda sp. SCSIO 64092]UOY05339.1 dolichyl-diphosphooligosaccharide--protein glycosyltransferase subunit STT3 [Muricauda sp. SCSIO 64092]